MIDINDPYGSPYTAGGLVRQNTPMDWEMAVHMAKIRDQQQANGLRHAPQPQGQTVGRFFVPPAITQNLHALAQNMQGGYQIGERDRSIENLINHLRGGSAPTPQQNIESALPSKMSMADYYQSLNGRD